MGFTCFAVWILHTFLVFQLSGYNLILHNQSNQSLEFAGLVTRSIMDDPSIDFRDYPGGVDAIEGQFVGKGYSFADAIMQAEHIAPGERIFINRKGAFKCENLAVMIINSSRTVTIIPAFYVMSTEFTHIAQITFSTGADNTLMFTLDCYNSGTDIPLLLWWLKTALSQPSKSMTI